MIIKWKIKKSNKKKNNSIDSISIPKPIKPRKISFFKWLIRKVIKLTYNKKIIFFKIFNQTKMLSQQMPL